MSAHTFLPRPFLVLRCAFCVCLHPPTHTSEEDDDVAALLARLKRECCPPARDATKSSSSEASAEDTMTDIVAEDAGCVLTHGDIWLLSKLYRHVLQRDGRPTQGLLKECDGWAHELVKNCSMIRPESAKRKQKVCVTTHLRHLSCTALVMLSPFFLLTESRV